MPKTIALVNEAQAIRSTSGVYYHRLEVPYGYLADHQGYNVFVTNLFSSYVGRMLAEGKDPNVDVLVFNHVLDFVTQPELEWETVRKYAKTVVCDVDDMWRLPNYHILKNDPRRTQPILPTTHFTHEEYVEYCVQEADHVTTTTNYLASKLRNFNPKVTIIPNTIDTTKEQYKVRREASEKLRIGYMGSTSHINDLMQLKRPLKKLWENYKGQFEIVICGVPPKPQRELLQNEVDLGAVMIDALTGGGVIEDYRIIEYKEVYEYATMFNEMDVSLIPLLENNFNAGKSPLKLIESCVMRAYPIVSYVEPYKELLTSNMFVVKTPNDWYNHLSKLIEDWPLYHIPLMDDMLSLAEEYDTKNQIHKLVKLIESF